MDGNNFPCEIFGREMLDRFGQSDDACYAGAVEMKKISYSVRQISQTGIPHNDPAENANMRPIFRIRGICRCQMAGRGKRRR